MQTWSDTFFYMPYYLPIGYRSGTAALPSVRKWVRKNELTAWTQILDKAETFKPVQRTKPPTLHAVVQCDLGAADFSCAARGIIGPYSRSFHVSVDAVYLWVGGEYDFYAPADRAHTAGRCMSSAVGEARSDFGALCPLFWRLRCP